VLLSQNVPEPAPPSTPLDLEYLYGFLLGTLSDTPSDQGVTTSSSQDPQIADPADDRARLCPICSLSVSPPPSIHQAATFPPINWRRILQEPYGYGRKQWDYTPLTPVLFSVNSFPGLNLGDALGKKFTGLDGWDERVLQDASRAISFRFSVHLSQQLLPCTKVNIFPSSLGIPLTGHR